jgi:hypothetical protein
MKCYYLKHYIIKISHTCISKFGRLDNMPKCCFENFPSLKSSKTRVIILNISFKIQPYRPNKHSYDTPVTTSSLQCKNILKNFVVHKITAKKQQQHKSRPLSTFAEKHARASPFPHHTSISATSARCTALYISAQKSHHGVQFAQDRR